MVAVDLPCEARRRARHWVSPLAWQTLSVDSETPSKIRSDACGVPGYATGGTKRFCPIWAAAICLAHWLPEPPEQVGRRFGNRIKIFTVVLDSRKVVG